MVYLISLLYAALLIRFVGPRLKKTYIPLLAVLIGIFFVVEYLGPKVLVERFGLPLSYGIIQPLTKAGLPTAFFCFVMLCPFMPVSWTVTKYARQNRTVLALMGCVLTLLHNVLYGFTGHAFYLQLFTAPAEMNLRMLISGFISVIAVAMLLPLFITSLPVVRKRMNPSLWKRIQLLAYPFWLLINAHALTLYVFKLPSVWEKANLFMMFSCGISVLLYGAGIIIWIAGKLRQRCAHA